MYTIETPGLIAELLERYDVSYGLALYYLDGDINTLSNYILEGLDSCYDSYEEVEFLLDMIENSPDFNIASEIFLMSLDKFTHLLKGSIIVYRGFNASSVTGRIGMEPSSLSGCVVPMQGLVSTTTSEFEAMQYASNANRLSLDDGCGVLIRIIINKPLQYLDIANMRGYGHTEERGELMFKDINIKFLDLVNVDEVNRVYMYNAEVV